MTADLATMWASLQMQLEAHRPDLVAGSSDTGMDGPIEAVPRTATPVALLTGFLGAGKSTLLAHLLGSPPEGLVIKAIVNDVGALPFDPTLVTSETDVRVELTSGCGCCERTSDLAATLDELATDPACDLIVLEGSGGADPLALAQVVAARPGLELDRIVTVVDAATLTTSRPAATMQAIIDRQMEAAHSIVVSHTDLVSEAAAQAAIASASAEAPGRIILASSLDAPADRALLPDSPRGARLPVDGHAWHGDLAVVTLQQGRTVARHRLETTLARARPGLLRAKGRLELDGRPHLIQMTPSTMAISDTPAGPTGLTLIATDHAVIGPIITLIADGNETSRP